MEGSDFDYFAQNRPKPEDFPTYEPQQPITTPEKEPEQKKISSTAIIILTFSIIMVVVILAVIGLALLSPLLQEDVELSISISKGGYTSGNILYFDTENIQVSVKNSGKETAYAENITLKIFGNNILEEEIPWPGGDILSGKRGSATVQAQVSNIYDTFLLRISVYYNGEYQDHDSVP